MVSWSHSMMINLPSSKLPMLITHMHSILIHPLLILYFHNSCTCSHLFNAMYHVDYYLRKSKPSLSIRSKELRYCWWSRLVLAEKSLISTIICLPVLLPGSPWLFFQDLLLIPLAFEHSYHHSSTRNSWWSFVMIF